jgi:hypothetical protein
VTGPHQKGGDVDAGRGVEVRDRRRFDALLTDLGMSSRSPLVVATLLEGSPRPGINVKDLTKQVDGIAEVYVLQDRAAFWLSDALGDKTLSVHSGWTRVYPASQEWRTLPWLAPNFRPDPDGRLGQVEKVVGAVLDAAFRYGGEQPAVPVSHGEPATAVVRDVVSPTQVLVEVEGHGQAIMRTQHLSRGLPADRLVARGQRFDGRWSPVGLMGEFAPDPVKDDLAGRVNEFIGDGVVTSAFVESVARERIRLLLHPRVPVTMIAEPEDDMALLASAGDVVTAEVIRLDGHLLACFSGKPPTPAMSVFPGGPPWLPDQRQPRSASDEASLDQPMAAGSGGDQCSALEEELARVGQALASAQSTIRELQSTLRRSRRLAEPEVFRDPDRQFVFELGVAYLIQVDESSRERYRWPDNYLIGPDFMVSVDRLVLAGGISREKIIEVCVDVLSGRARDRTARAVKEWLVSRNGPPLVRPSDGARAMRARLQNFSHGARRLKYWCLPSGVVELDSVSVHDENLRCDN